MNGDLNWGDDKRTFPKLAAFIQKWTQITFMKHLEPPSITAAIFPPLLIIQIPIPWGKKAFVPAFYGQPLSGVDVRPSMHFHLGWRRDMNSGEFYFSVALKKMQRQMLW